MRNDVLLFNHRSALVNCDSEGANVQVQTQGNTLIIKEEYLGKQEANCNCMMNLDYAIRNLSHQTYRIKVITPTATLAEFDLKVDEKTEAIILILDTSEMGKIADNKNLKPIVKCLVIYIIH